MKDIISELKTWRDTIQETDKQLEAARCVFGDGESKFTEAFEELQCKYTEAVAEVVGDAGGWLYWYWLDNDMGNRGLVGCNAFCELKAIVTLKDLEQLIISS